MSTFIKPTIGRVVWVYPQGHSREHDALPGLISFVHSDSVINVAAFTQNGEPLPLTSVALIPQGEPLPESGNVATWMPYQAAQAQKA